MEITDTPAVEHNNGYFVCWRTESFGELLRRYPNAFRLLALIASRARWRDGMSVDGLCQNQCFLGESDAWRALRMSPRCYRTAKRVLEKLGQVTFKATNLGTIATLTARSVFAASAPCGDRPTDRRKTGKRQAKDGQTTTNKNSKTENTEKQKDKKEGKNGNTMAPHSLTSTQLIHLEKTHAQILKSYEEQVANLFIDAASNNGDDVAKRHSALKDLATRLREIEDQLQWPHRDLPLEQL